MKIRLIFFVDTSEVEKYQVAWYQEVKAYLEQHKVEFIMIAAPNTNIDDIRKLGLTSCEGWPKKISLSSIFDSIIIFIHALFSKRINLSKKFFINIQTFSLILQATTFLKDYAPSVIFAKKFDSCYELAAVSNYLKIPTACAQHGNYYCGKITNLKREIEWPASLLFVWNKNSLKFCKMNFPKSNTKYFVSGPIWIAPQNKPIKNSLQNIMIVESDPKAWSKRLIRQTIALGEEYADVKVTIKPHPYATAQKRSLVDTLKNVDVSTTPFHQATPQIAIVFGSSSVWELIWRGTAVLTLVSRAEELDRYPLEGTFLNSSDGQFNLLLKLRQLIQDNTFKKEWIEAQYKEFVEVFPDPLNSMSELVKILRRYTNSS